MVLEITEWRWTIEEILAQPEQELDAVISLKAVGEKIRQQVRNRNTNADVEKI